MDYDLKIRGGTIVDGTGRPRFEGDVGIVDGKLAAVGDAPGSAKREIDARGKNVVPGFVDVHTHYDAQVLWDRMLSHSPWHGVTTVVMGNCGVGFAPCRESDRDFIMEMVELVEGIPYESMVQGMGDWGFESFPQYLDLIERRGTAINVAVNIAHHAVKVYVQGTEALDRFPNGEEMRKQKEIVLEGLQAGAVGLSIFNGVAHVGPGGRPVPSRLTLPKQFHEFMTLIDEFGRGGVDANLGLAFNDATAPELADQYNISWNHAPLRSLELANELAEKGVRWHPQIDPLPNTFEGCLEDPFMFCIDMPTVYGVPPLQDLINPLFELTVPERELIYRTSEFQEAFVRQTEHPKWHEGYWPYIRFNYYPQRPEMEGVRIVDLAAQRGQEPGRVLVDEALASRLEARWMIEKPARDPEELLEILRTNRAIRIGNGDAGAHQGQLADYRWPTVMLSEWVRERGLELERAIQLMTACGANAYGIFDRGTLTEGLAADVVVYDPDNVQDGPLHRINDLPGGSRRLFSDGLGIEYVVVNGTIIREDEQMVLDSEGPLPGSLLREFTRNADRSPLPIGGLAG